MDSDPDAKARFRMRGAQHSNSRLRYRDTYRSSVPSVNAGSGFRRVVALFKGAESFGTCGIKFSSVLGAQTS